MKVEFVLFAILTCRAAADIQLENKLNDSLISNRTSINSTSRDVETLIVGGTPAIKNEFPWLVHLRIGNSFCGGTLISLDMVLTAAHCVYLKSASSITVTAGDHNRTLNEGTEQTRAATGVGVLWHERYREDTVINDIALIRLKSNLTKSSAVNAILLPPSNFAINVTGNGTVAGWGAEVYEGPAPTDVVRKVNVPIVSNEICRRSYASLTSNQFCAGRSGLDSCQGDSGGTFVCSNGTSAVFCGIVSYGSGCGMEKYPGVYTKVSSYISWIAANKNFTSPPPISAASSIYLSFPFLFWPIIVFFVKLNY